MGYIIHIYSTSNYDLTLFEKRRTKYVYGLLHNNKQEGCIYRRVPTPRTSNRVEKVTRDAVSDKRHFFLYVHPRYISLMRAYIQSHLSGIIVDNFFFRPFFPDVFNK